MEFTAVFSLSATQSVAVNEGLLSLPLALFWCLSLRYLTSADNDSKPGIYTWLGKIKQADATLKAALFCCEAQAFLIIHHKSKNHVAFIEEWRHQRLTGLMREDAADTCILEASRTPSFRPAEGNMYSDHVHYIIRSHRSVLHFKHSKVAWNVTAALKILINSHFTDWVCEHFWLYPGLTNSTSLIMCTCTVHSRRTQTAFLLQNSVFYFRISLDYQKHAENVFFWQIYANSLVIF